ncbi:hypothetical protein DKT77_07305 [Meridianimarinicoccus roseus]|jgi:hypothetical protein|uniref:PQ loop repeat protein n=1 Tax=Meridianimarinicoccus roseus TaxID=2072018 RepID=A0A2V2LD15_9RHOB|nr:hypothetical protein [Meridianimarinicoccus roseus]PWR03265.1 hypothetical protein DKT77_07305 [Meridianimarinicoccus roseus]
MQDILEASMLIAFSLGWYMSVIKMLRTGVAAGKSKLCVSMVCFGYCAGVAAKLFEWSVTGALNPLIWLYAWNFAVTGFDLFLVFYLGRKAGRADFCAAT